MTVKWRWWRFRFEFDTFGEWRWRQPLGWGPRWLRRVWCLAFHWRRFDEIAATTCNVTLSPGVRGWPGSALMPFRPWLHLLMHHRTYGPDVEVYEHIRILGCYPCQLPWGRRYRYSTTTHPEEP